MSHFLTDGKRLSVLAGAVAAAAVAAAFFLEPPWEYRGRVFDHARVEAHNELISRLQRHAETHGALPDDLGQLDATPNFFYVPDWRDPETRRPYGYKKTGPAAYRLCINFSLDSSREPLGPYLHDDHVPGLNCYDETVSLDRK